MARAPDEDVFPFVMSSIKTMQSYQRFLKEDYMGAIAILC